MSYDRSRHTHPLVLVIKRTWIVDLYVLFVAVLILVSELAQ